VYAIYRYNFSGEYLCTKKEKLLKVHFIWKASGAFYKAHDLTDLVDFNSCDQAYRDNNIKLLSSGCCYPRHP
jgi:hypothetical protein